MAFAKMRLLAPTRAARVPRLLGALALAAALAACGGGGGGGDEQPVVTGVAAAQVLEGASGTSVLSFVVTLDRTTPASLPVTFSTSSTAKAGGGGTGSATGGSACAPGVDFLHASSAVTIPSGARTGELRVTVCGDTSFEPTETLLVSWSASGRSGSAIGTIVNDDAGGLNGTGLASSFGRDANPLTNGSTDGRLGFSYAQAGACTRDNVTGLLWEGKAGGAGDLHDPARTFTWAELAAFVAAVNAQALCGFTDWRVPTPEELASVVDNGVAAAPVIDSAFFPNTMAARYWTSTGYRDGVGQDAWFVDFATGSIAVDNRSRTFNARLVSRGGTSTTVPLPASCGDAARFAVHADGTVTDNRTGLMWKQCAEGFSGAACNGAGLALAWSAAVARPATVNADATLNLGYQDWRLPTRAELSSIAEREQCFNPAINTTVFPNAEPLGHWSSTPYAFNDTLAWAVDFFDGQTAPALKAGTGSSNKRVRLVRAGQ